MELIEWCYVVPILKLARMKPKTKILVIGPFWQQLLFLKNAIYNHHKMAMSWLEKLKEFFYQYILQKHMWLGHHFLRFRNGSYVKFVTPDPSRLLGASHDYVVVYNRQFFDLKEMNYVSHMARLITAKKGNKPIFISSP